MTDNNNNPKSPYDVELPQSIIDSFARFLLPEIRRWYESEKGQHVFHEWEQAHSKDK